MAHREIPRAPSAVPVAVAIVVVFVLGVVTLINHPQARLQPPSVGAAVIQADASGSAAVPRVSPVSSWLFGVVLASLAISLVVIRDRKPKDEQHRESLLTRDFTGAHSLRPGERWFNPGQAPPGEATSLLDLVRGIPRGLIEEPFDV